MLKILKGPFFRIFGTMRLFRILIFFSKNFLTPFSFFFKNFLMSPKRPPFSLFDILQQNECYKILKGPFVTFFSTMRLPSKFLSFFQKFFEVPFIFLKFCNRMDVKKSQRVPSFTVFGIVRFFKRKRNNFRLKIRFSQAQRAIFYFCFLFFLTDRSFFYATFSRFVFTEGPPQFLPETKRFARGLLKVFGTM